MTIRSLPIYDQYFGANPRIGNWEALNLKSSLPLGQREVDFSYDERTWCDVAKSIAIFLLKILIPIWGLYSLAKYITQRLIMLPLYPAQSRIVRYFLRGRLPVSIEELNHSRDEISNHLNSRGFIVRHVVLEKNGVRYSGLLVGHRDAIANGKWVVQACGNLSFIEHFVYSSSQINKDLFQFNTLLINGPAVGLSQGEANPSTMGDAQQVGITFLETAIRANKIVLAGYSLGGASMGQAILKHNFRSDVRYLAIRQMTFDRANNICGKFVEERARFLKNLIKKITKKIVKWSGTELDSVAASRRLQQLGIREVIIQAGNRNVAGNEIPLTQDFKDDRVIPPNASLGYRLIKENIIENKVFHCIASAGHNDSISVLTRPINEMMQFGN